MSKTIGRNRNINNEATISNVTLNALTSTKISDVNNNRIAFEVSNDSSQDVWIKFEPAAANDLKEGILLFKRSNFEMPTDNIYTGEVSAIAEADGPTIHITEY